MLVKVLGSCSGAGWAKRAEERGDGECGEQGWLGDAPLGLAQPQPCCPPPSPANVTPSARSTSPTMVPIKEKKTLPSSFQTQVCSLRSRGCQELSPGREGGASPPPSPALMPPYLKRARSYFTPCSHRGCELGVIPRLFCHPG